MRALSIPIRKRILELYKWGRSTREIAQFAGFCVAARGVRQQLRKRGTLEPRTPRCGRETLLPEERKQPLLARLPRQGPCAPWLFAGPMSGESFWAWISKGLVPTSPPAT
jgi:transposase